MAVEREQFAITPDAALIQQRRWKCAAHARSFSTSSASMRSSGEDDFKQARRNRAIVDGFVNRKARAALLLETRQLS